MGASVRPQPPDPWLTRWIEQFTTAPSDATRVRPAPQGPTIGAPNTATVGHTATVDAYPGQSLVNLVSGFVPGVGDVQSAAQGGRQLAEGHPAQAGLSLGLALLPAAVQKFLAARAAASAARGAGTVLNEGVDFGSGSLRGALGTPSEAETQALLDAIRPATAAKPLAEAEAAAEYFRRTRQPFPAIREGPGPSPAAVAEREARNAAHGRRDFVADSIVAKGMERVTRPAIRLPDGTVVTGNMHLSIRDQVGDQAENAVDGWVTSTGRFVDRAEGDALMTAEFPNAVSRYRKRTGDTQTLDSENLAMLRRMPKRRR